MHIDGCGRRRGIKRQGLLFTLLIRRTGLLQILHRTSLFHPKNAEEHKAVPMRGPPQIFLGLPRLPGTGSIETGRQQAAAAHSRRAGDVERCPARLLRELIQLSRPRYPPSQRRAPPAAFHDQLWSPAQFDARSRSLVPHLPELRWRTSTSRSSCRSRRRASRR